MRDILTNAIQDSGADYIEIRAEESENTSISFRGRDLNALSRTSGFGGSVRAAVNGGWGFVSFNSLDSLKERVQLAVRQARLVGKDKTQLAEVEPVVDEVRPDIVKDPRTVPLADKKALLERHTDVIYSLGEKIQTSSVSCGDTHSRVYFANSEGSWLDTESFYMSGGAQAIARDADEIQQHGCSFASTRDYGVLENRDDEVRKTAQSAIEMLSAPQVKGGTYTIIIDPALTGLFVHEAFGHLSEADNVAENPQFLKLMVLGRRFGGKHLNIIDGADVQGRGGSLKYDSEGVAKRPTYLVREGELVGRLHDRESAAKMGEPITGNARAHSYGYPPIVRMTNTYIPAGNAKFEEMLSEVDEGLYIVGTRGGQTSGEMFTFSAGEAWMIRKGQIRERVRGVTLTGNVFTTLENIDAIGDDLVWPEKASMCGKGGQPWLPVGFGGPHMRIRNCIVGGK